MSTELHQELAGLRALGLLDEAERRDFEAEIAAKPELAALYGHASGPDRPRPDAPARAKGPDSERRGSAAQSPCY